MKALSELGISPYPWKKLHGMIADANGICVYGNGWQYDTEDGDMLSAAPELYDYLVQCVKSIEYILDWQNVEPVVEDNTRAMLVNAKAALAKASGEEVKE